MRKTCLVFIFLFIFLAFTPQIFARHGRVLGDESQQISELPLSEGPGLLRPDSPFYFLDLWRDNAGLFLASFTPEAKAKLHLKIAAERIIEVKMMLEAKNVSPSGLDTALSNITQNIEGARVALKDNKNKGGNVQKLASELNGTLDREQQALRLIAKTGDEKVRLKVRAIEEAIEDDEIEIEDELSEDELENEVQDELEEEVENEVEEASESARRTETLIEKLNEEASKSAQRALKKREEAVKKAIKEENKSLQKTQEDLKRQEEKKQEDLRRVQEKTVEEARRAAKEAQKAAEKLKEAQEKASEIRQAGQEKD